MADYCKQCSIAHFGEDTKDLAYPRLDSEGMPKTLNEDEGWVELCEGCGGTLVLNDGTCITHTEEQHEEIWRGYKDV